jgi:hypothetical protein
MTVVPNLKKIAKAIATQASILSKALPSQMDGTSFVNGMSATSTHLDSTVGQ